MTWRDWTDDLWSMMIGFVLGCVVMTFMACELQGTPREVEKKKADTYAETHRDMAAKVKSALARTNPADPLKVRCKTVTSLLSLDLNQRWTELDSWKAKTAAMCETFMGDGE